MSIRTIVTKLEETITDAYNLNYWLYSVYDKITYNARWTNDYFGEVLFKSIKMDGISVNVYINIVNNKSIELKIESDRIYNSNTEEMYLYFDEVLVTDVFNLEFYQYVSAFRKINGILRNCKFDKLHGRFIDPNNICPCGRNQILIRKALTCLTKNNPNIITNCNECAVCYETTMNLTSCNHCVCLVCLDTIAQSINMNHRDLSPAEQPIICPICRNDINDN